MGWLVPHVMCIGTDKDYVPQEQIEKTSIIYKKIQISDVSAFINTKNTFKPMAQMLYLGTSLKAFMLDMDKEKARDLCSRVRGYVNDTFEDSARRFDQE